METNKPVNEKYLNSIIQHVTSIKDGTIETEFTQQADIMQLMRYGFSLRAEGDVNDIQLTSGYIYLDEEINALNVQGGTLTITDQSKLLVSVKTLNNNFLFDKGDKYTISGYFGSNIYPHFHNKKYTKQYPNLPRPFQSQVVNRIYNAP